MKSPNKMRNVSAKFRVKYYLPEEYSDEIISEMKRKLKNLNRHQLELLICVLTREIANLEHLVNTCPSCARKMNVTGTVSKTKCDLPSSDIQMYGSNDTVQKTLRSAINARRIWEEKSDTSNLICDDKRLEARSAKNDDIHTDQILQADKVYSARPDHEERVQGSFEEKKNISQATLLDQSLAEEGLVILRGRDQRSLRVLDQDSGETVYEKFVVKTGGSQKSSEHPGVSENCERAGVYDNSSDSVENDKMRQGDKMRSTASCDIREDHADVSFSLVPSQFENQQANIGSMAMDEPTCAHQQMISNTVHAVQSDNHIAIAPLMRGSSSECFTALGTTATVQSSIAEDGTVCPSDVSGDEKKFSKFACPGCMSQFSSHSDPNSHTQEVHQCTVDSCLICKKAVKCKHNLSVHVKNNHSRETVLCSYCGKLVLCVRLKTHMDKVHERPSYTCHICQKGFLKRECLDGHINKHSNTKPYICEFCGRKYVYSTSLSRHKKGCSKATVPSHLLHPRNPEEKDNIHVCEVCGMRFEGASGLRDHYNAKHSSKFLCCSFCDKKFQWRPSYNRHVKKCRDRSDVERAKCKGLRHSNSTGKQYTCICGKEYPYRQSFRRHQKNCQQKRDVESYDTNSIPIDIPFSEYLGSTLELSATLNL